MNVTRSLPHALSRSVAVAALAACGLAAHAAPATYVVEPNHTYVTFEARHFNTSTNRGRFDQKEGTVTIDTAAKTGKADITIQTGSINTGSDKFNEHLKSADFFDAAKYPTARFVGEKFTFDGDKVTSVAGTLTLHGVSQPVTLKATNYTCYMSPLLKKQVCGGDFETTIQRSSYGITYGVPMIPDDVRLLIQIEAYRQ